MVQCIEVEQISDVRPDWNVLVFAFTVAVISGLGFGIAPALAATKPDAGPALKEGASTSFGAGGVKCTGVLECSG